MPEIIVIAHNIRSTHNVGSIFRTCEGFGVTTLILSGYTPYPKITGDSRLPHIVEKLTAQIHKTALGAETLVPFEHIETVDELVTRLEGLGIPMIALEQASGSVDIRRYVPPVKLALVLGEEVDGIDDTILVHCQDTIEIPMSGQKESFNVSVAAGIALYAITAQ